MFELSETPISKEDIFDLCEEDIPVKKKKIHGEYIGYVAVSACLDLECTSFYEDGQKRGCMYAFGFGIQGRVYVGRSWTDFLDVLKGVSKKLDLSSDKRLMVWVHNLSYDFQWFRRHLSFTDVFAIDTRKVVYAVTDTGIEFRCSYLLSGYSAANLHKVCLKYPVSKMIGDLDYRKIRTPNTPLTDKETGYLVHDCLLVMGYIQEKIETEGIEKLPLTKTGYVRKYIRKVCLTYPAKGDKRAKNLYYSFKKTIARTTLFPTEYKLARLVFMGGFTHANAKYTGKIIENVSSIDFTSSYPSVLVAEKYPMGTGRKIDTTTIGYDEFIRYTDIYCCMFVLTLHNVSSKINHDHYISKHKCLEVIKPKTDNGRIVSADKLTICVTDVDYRIIKTVYDYDSFQVADLWIYPKGYLPTLFVDAMLDLYQKKTELKGVAGKEAEYLQSKEQLNSFYGMCVTAIDRDTQIYDNVEGWMDPETPVLETVIDEYNTNTNRFLSYLWGVWCTAYARYNLWTMIIECGNDYIYSDTDSGKIRNIDRHKEYIDLYNETVTAKIKVALEEHGIPIQKACPKTIKGIEKPLGVWDFEGTYKRFKTLGAKRYITENEDGTYSLTCAGVNKKSGLEYLKTLGDPIEHFVDGVTFPREYSGRLTHIYFDDSIEGDMVDYMCIPYHYKELSYIHMEESEYNLSLDKDYLKYLVSLIMEVMDDEYI